MSITSAQKDTLDRMCGIAKKTTLGSLISENATDIDANEVSIAALEVIVGDPSIDDLSVKKVARATYDFDVDGGAVSSIGLGITLPDNAIIVRSFIDIITGMTSAGGAATIAIDTEGAGDVLAAVDADTISGQVEGIQDGTMAAAVKTSAAKEITASIAVEALTAGKFIVFIEYVISE